MPVGTSRRAERKSLENLLFNSTFAVQSAAFVSNEMRKYLCSRVNPMNLQSELSSEGHSKETPPK
jgi:hypothetical protein